MPLHDMLRRFHAKGHADVQGHVPAGRRKEVCPDPRPFTHIELESYLEHFKDCKLLHFPDPQARYFRHFARTCKLHADYVMSFDGIQMIEICCGETIPYVDYLKFGEEEKRCKSRQFCSLLIE